MTKILLKREIKNQIRLLENIVASIKRYENINSLTLNEKMIKAMLEIKINTLKEYLNKIKNKISLNEIDKIIKKLNKKEVHELINGYQNLELKYEDKRLFDDEVVLDF